MIIKKHVAESAKKALSYISQNFNDSALIISSTKVNGKDVIYFALDQQSKQKSTYISELTPAGLTIVSKKIKTSTNSKNIFISNSENVFYPQIKLDTDLNSNNSIQLTKEKNIKNDILEEITSRIDLGSGSEISFRCNKRINTKNMVASSDSDSYCALSAIDEIKDSLNQLHEHLHLYNQSRCNRLDELTNLLINNFSIAHETNKAIISMQTASVEAMKKLADSVVHIKSNKYIPLNKNIETLKNKNNKKYLYRESQNSIIGSYKMFAFIACFSSLLFLLQLNISELNAESIFNAFVNSLTNSNPFSRPISGNAVSSDDTYTTAHFWDQKSNSQHDKIIEFIETNNLTVFSHFTQPVHLATMHSP